MRKLSDFADIERAPETASYPEGTILMQVSATAGQVEWHEGGPVGTSKYVAVTPRDESPLKPRFLFWYLRDTYPHWCLRIKQGLNVTVEDIERYPIKLPLIAGMKGWDE